MGARIYGDHHIFFPQAFSQQKLEVVYQPKHKSHLFGTISTICHEIGIHCKVSAYLGALLYSCTKIKNTLHILCHFGEALHTVVRR